MPIMNITEYARHRGVHRNKVYGHLNAGKITRRDDGQIDSDQADREWAANVAPRKGGVPKKGEERPPPVPGALAAANTALKTIEAEIKQLKLKQMAGELVDREKVERQAFGWARQLRDAWAAWPARIGPRFAADVLHTLEQDHTVDQRYVTILLEKYVHEHLTELSASPPPAV